MAVRSTTSSYYPSPPGKLLARQGLFRNVVQYAMIRSTLSEGRRKRRNMSTAPLGRTGNELIGYTGTLRGPGYVPTIMG